MLTKGDLNMSRELFLDYFSEHEVPVIRKRRHTFLKMDDEKINNLKQFHYSQTL